MGMHNLFLRHYWETCGSIWIQRGGQRVLLSNGHHLYVVVIEMWKPLGSKRVSESDNWIDSRYA